jgi:hypothetical protein
MKSLLLTLGLLTSSIVNSAVLNFDDLALPDSYDPLNDLNYGGFTWDSRWYAGDTSNNTYSTSASSGTQYLSNGNSVNSLTISRDTAFNFDGASFGHPNRSSNIASWVQIAAYDATNTLIGMSGQLSLSSTMTWFNIGFNNVSSLVITRNAAWFTMDDFTYDSNLSAVPVPAAAFLFGPALLGFVALRRKQK